MERSGPRVSVIIIFLNAGRFIQEAIASIETQTYTDWEILLVDDGSSDVSVSIARDAAARDPARIRYLRHPDGANHGMSAARQLGLEESRGDLIALLDADDVYLPRKLEYQVALLDAHPEVDMVYGVTEFWHSWTGDAAGSQLDRPNKRGIPPGTIHPPGALVAPVIKDEARTPCTCGVLMRKGAVRAAGGFEASFRGMFEDQVFFLKMFQTARVLVDGKCLDRYRQHPQSHCNVERAAGRFGTNSDLTDDRRRFLEWLEEFLGQNTVADRSLRRGVRRELLPFRYPALRPFWRLLAPLRSARIRRNQRRRHARSGEVQPSI